MTRIDQAWVFTDAEPPRVLRAGVVAGETRIVSVGDQAVHLLDGRGAALRAYPELNARGAALGTDGCFFLCRSGELFATDALGEPLWTVDLETKSVGRVFAGNDGDVVVFLARQGRFLMERYAQSDGAYVETRTLERRRALLSADGTRIWTRDARGISCFRATGFGVDRVALAANGPMDASGDWAVTRVDRHVVVGVQKGAVRWRTPLAGRDLRAVALTDGLEVEDDEFEEADVGRPTIDGERVYVPDANGVLHSLLLRDGSLQWRFEGRHYPTLTELPTAKRFGEWIAYVGGDEWMYLLNPSGQEKAALELPGAPVGQPVVADGALVIYADGLRAFEAVD